MALLVGLDIGTTTIKAAVYDTDRGGLVRLATRPTPVITPGPGRGEHDPESLWQAAAACLKEAAAGLPVAGLAISSLAEAGLPVDRDGRPLYPVIAWYDRRTEPQAAWLEARVPVAELHRITGQRASPSFGACKWLWIRENHPEIARKMAKWLSVPDYLFFRLTGEQVTDRTIASRTLLLDQQRLDWSPALLNLVGLDPGQLPPVRPSGTPAGQVSAAAAAETGLPVGTACVLGGHDHLCAALAVGADHPGAAVELERDGPVGLIRITRLSIRARAVRGRVCLLRARHPRAACAERRAKNCRRGGRVAGPPAGSARSAHRRGIPGPGGGGPGRDWQASRTGVAPAPGRVRDAGWGPPQPGSPGRRRDRARPGGLLPRDARRPGVLAAPQPGRDGSSHRAGNRGGHFDRWTGPAVNLKTRSRQISWAVR